MTSEEFTIHADGAIASFKNIEKLIEKHKYGDWPDEDVRMLEHHQKILATSLGILDPLLSRFVKRTCVETLAIDDAPELDVFEEAVSARVPSRLWAVRDAVAKLRVLKGKVEASAAVSPGTPIERLGIHSSTTTEGQTGRVENMRKALERLLQEADNVGREDPAQQRDWAASAKRLIDAFLGPGPTNIHSDAFYEFDFAKTHPERIAILRAILLSTPIERHAGEVENTREKLERLLDEAEHLGNDAQAQRVWNSRITVLMEPLVGSAPTCVRPAAWNQFIGAESHAERTAILSEILLSTRSTHDLREAATKSPERHARANSTRALLFASYAREDFPVVKPILTAVRQAGVDVWLDIDSLAPGSQWSNQIADALDNSTGLLLFLSSASARSQFVRQELDVFLKNNRLIIPIMIEKSLKLPPELELRIGAFQWVEAAGASPDQIDRAAMVIAQAAAVGKRAERLSSSSRALNRELADSLADDKRKSAAATSPPAPPRSVFVVHGHDVAFLDQVESYLKELGVEAVVLRRIGGAAQSLFQKFMQWGKETRFALVLLSADDLGASRAQYESDGIAERSLQFRARQNVILELGFFYGQLGWENVFVLYRSPPKIFPNFERPSDLDGVVFDHVDDAGRWKGYLRSKLQERGFALAAKLDAALPPA